MQFYTVEEVAKKLGVGKGTIFSRLREGKFPHAIQGKKKGKWSIPECCVAPGSTCFADKGDNEASNGEMSTLEKDRDKLKIKAEIKSLQAEIDGIVDKEFIAESHRLRAELDQEREKFNSDVRACSLKTEEQRERARILDNKEAQLKKALGEIKEYAEMCAHDLLLLREYYQNLCSSCRRNLLPEMALKDKEFDFSEWFYTSQEPLPEIVLDSGEFNEESEEE